MAALTLGGGCALQEDLVAVNNSVIALEQRASRQGEKAEADRAALRSEIARYHEEQVKLDEAYRSRHAELHALMKDLREEIQELRGELEESQYEARQGIGALSESESRQKGRWENLEKSLQNSLDHIVRLEQYLGMEPSERLASLEAGEDEPEKGKPKAKKTPDERYAMAKQRFDRGEYEAARQLFEVFLKQYPKSKRADNARFWIGEIYYREKWYEKAILEYQKVIENYPKGDKVRGALLKQGFAFLNLGDKANARLILKELVRKYPASNEANIAKKKLKTLQ
ncbi:MAG: tol-pal system protein YbgF [Desulfobacterales bacterium]|nr:tol-pal system protein YbgF [Desulfobacterales bacterium]